MQTDPKLMLTVRPGPKPGAAPRHAAPRSFPDLCTSSAGTVCRQRPHQSHRSEVCCDTARLLRESRRNTSLTLSAGPQRTSLPSSGQGRCSVPPGLARCVCKSSWCQLALGILQQGEMVSINIQGTQMQGERRQVGRASLPQPDE